METSENIEISLDNLDKIKELVKQCQRLKYCLELDFILSFTKGIKK